MFNETSMQVSQAFVRLHKITDAKLAAGLHDRQRIVKALSQGKVPTGYRVDWLKATAMCLIDTLDKAAQDFNKAHSGDHISVQDLADALANALNLLKQSK